MRVSRAPEPWAAALVLAPRSAMASATALGGGFDFRFTYLESRWAVVALAIAAAILTAAVYWRPLRGLGRWRAGLLAALRYLAVLAALVILLRPVMRYEVVTRLDESILVLVDSSWSMTVADSVGGETRLESARRVGAGEAMRRLSSIFRLEAFAFAGPGALRPLETARLLDARLADPGAADAPAGPPIAALEGATDLAAAWSEAKAHARRLAAVILLSDGRDHGAAARAIDGGLEGVDLPGAPVHAVGFGSGGEVGDLAVETVSGETRVLRGSEVSLRVSVRSRFRLPRQSRLEVLSGGRSVESRDVTIEPGASEIALRIVPDRAGRVIYEVGLSALADEATAENNRAHAVLHVTDRPLRVLFFEGRARWLYKFARAALASDPELRVTAVVHLGSGRFLEQGAPAGDLSGGFPESREALSAFDVVLLGNVSPESIGPDARESLIAWVESGGGLVFAGGEQCLRTLGSGSIGRALPVEIAGGERIEGPLIVRAEVSAFGHPITSGIVEILRSAESETPLELAESFAARGGRPGGEVLLSAVPAGSGGRGAGPDGGADAAKSPLLAVRQYGEGRIAAWLTEADWRWVTSDPRGESGRFFTQLWIRMARWAGRREGGGDRPGQPVLSPSRARAGERVEVAIDADASAGGSAIDADTGDAPRVEVEGPDGERRALEMRREETRWTGSFIPRRRGIHVVRRVDGAGGGEDSEAVLAAFADAREQEEPRPDWDLLRGVAEATGGKFYTLAESGRLAEEIIAAHPGLVSEVELGAELDALLFAFLLVCLTLEWCIRRRFYAV